MLKAKKPLAAQKAFDTLLLKKTPEAFMGNLFIQNTEPPPLNDHMISKFSLNLLHLYAENAYLGLWNPNDTQWTYRDRDLAPNRAQHTHQHEVWLRLILEAIFLDDPILRQHFFPKSWGQPNENLIKYYYSLVQTTGKYASDDVSDDSDSDDDKLLKEKANTTQRATDLRFKNTIVNKKKLCYKPSGAQGASGQFAKRGFWEKTRRTTPGKCGLVDSTSFKPEQIPSLIKNLKTDSRFRCTLPPPRASAKVYSPVPGHQLHVRQVVNAGTSLSCPFKRSGITTAF